MAALGGAQGGALNEPAPTLDSLDPQVIAAIFGQIGELQSQDQQILPLLQMAMAQQVAEGMGMTQENPFNGVAETGSASLNPAATSAAGLQQIA